MRISAVSYNIPFAKKSKAEGKKEKTYPGGMNEKQFNKFQKGKQATNTLMEHFRDPEFEKVYQNLPEGDALFYDACHTVKDASGKIKVIGPSVHYCYNYRNQNGSTVPESDTLEIDPEKGIEKEELIGWLKEVSKKEN